MGLIEMKQEKIFEILCKTNMLQNENYNNHEIKYEK